MARIEIWNGDIMKKVRLRLMHGDRSGPPCAQCDVDGTLYARLHFEAWQTYYNSAESRHVKA